MQCLKLGVGSGARHYGTCTMHLRDSRRHRDTKYGSGLPVATGAPPQVCCTTSQRSAKPHRPRPRTLQRRLPVEATPVPRTMQACNSIVVIISLFLPHGHATRAQPRSRVTSVSLTNNQTNTKYCNLTVAARHDFKHQLVGPLGDQGESRYCATILSWRRCRATPRSVTSCLWKESKVALTDTQKKIQF